MAKNKAKDFIDRLKLEAMAIARSERVQQFTQSDMMKRLAAASDKIRQNDVVKTLALAPKSIGRRLLTAFAIALASAVVALLAGSVWPLSVGVKTVDEAVYDAFFQIRAPESRADGPVVMILVDDESLAALEQGDRHVTWKWPRDTWAEMLIYLEHCKAKAVTIDITFDQRSQYERYDGDDTALGETLDNCGIPVVIAESVPKKGGRAAFYPKVQRPVTFGAANIESVMVRSYNPEVRGVPSLAIETVRQAREPIPPWADKPFLLHYYGPHEDKGKMTFRQVRASEVLLSAEDFIKKKGKPPMPGTEPEVFQNKIVLIGATADGTSDIKISPVSKIYPGTEYQATAVSNLLENRRVRKIGIFLTLCVAFVGASIASIGAVVPKRARFKMPITALGVGFVFGFGYLLFVPSRNIFWLPLGIPILAGILSTTGGLAWTYLVEDRQRRVIKKFLAQYVAPDVAEELDKRGTISLGGIERTMTVLFSDIAGFTTVSEKLKGDQLEKFMNFYLSELSAVVFEYKGTLDKYIGDAIMTFWNAPLDQPDHAERACRTALGMKLREQQLSKELMRMAEGNKVYTRIGINTGRMKVGNYGSAQKVNYTVFGDPVNAASRFEGANKLYGSQILVGQSTVDLVKDKFIFRPLDLLKVKGKDEAIAVYELLGEGQGLDGELLLANEFTRAFSAYLKQQWDESETILVALSERFSNDGPTDVLLKRVRNFREHSPGEGWDGTYTAKDK